ncbi:hypothetical protein O979_01745 [Mycobacterium avium subsp. paratuberculosis 10-4404]|nr:hypothetical protein O979_01745 [Mycobacterium avium subsp. paratuberculosis 10-4404]ETB07928.1 hypothetical protein O978_01860 [Mycobacterium avium subsp. paratuberculosis 10-5864]ETB14687.1 hypothetical protein O980_01895 [Mycobacterium avium subsp. paratuberculosis 08-8281]ETB36144.1 hypothetical protein O977_01945 [Mycobacterium avium subsp. paratuberculosis 10-5975]ETB54684.1 hypothetical protein O976_02090 [Mycobacterium avium subsp. paratuberculosis 10-8425]
MERCLRTREWRIRRMTVSFSDGMDSLRQYAQFYDYH